VQPYLENKRLSQSQKPVLNKLEERFLEKLKVDYADLTIYSQALRLELARGHWYKPDFFIPDAIIHLGTNRKFALAYEVKGPHAFRGGFENLKVAARIHTWCMFYLVWWDKAAGGWQRQKILP